MPKCLNVATADGVRLTATVKSLDKSLTQVMMVKFSSSFGKTFLFTFHFICTLAFPGAVDDLRGLEGGVGDVGDGGEPVLCKVLSTLGIGHSGQGDFVASSD